MFFNKRILAKSIISIILLYFAYLFINRQWGANGRNRNCFPLLKNKFKESHLTHRLLDNLKGIEIGASSHNPFCLDTINVNFTNDTTIYQSAEIKFTGTSAKVDVVAPGDNLPFSNDSFDFVINSHVIEHFYDPIKAIKEWLRVVKKGGYVYMIIPHKERTFDKPKNRTTLNELIKRHENPPDSNFIDDHGHHSVWITEDFIEICKHFNWKTVAVQDIDDKVGNGFTIVIQK